MKDNLRANELRIGNTLQRLDGSLFNVTIHDLGVIHTWNGNESLLPRAIQLTQEWLLKFEWEEVKSNVFTFKDNNYYSIFCDGGCELLVNGEYWANDIKYVHQLQNLYFALTGHELELTEKPQI
jgi:hypothetical protein